MQNLKKSNNKSLTSLFCMNVKCEDLTPKSQNMENMENLPKRNINIVRQLELYRLEKKISLQKLASELDVAFSTVSRWFSGKNNLNKIQSYHIEKFLKKRGIYDKK